MADLAVHSSTLGLKTSVGVVASLTSNTFSPPAGSVIVVCIGLDSAQNGITVSSMTDSLGSHLAWTKRVGVAGNDVSSEVWWAYCPNAQTNMTVSVSPSISVRVMFSVIVFQNADPIQNGAVGSGSSLSGVPTANLTTTRARSWVLGQITDFSNGDVPTFPGGQTCTWNSISCIANFDTGQEASWTQGQNAITPNSGTVVTVNDTSLSIGGASIEWTEAIMEVLAAPAAAVSPIANPIAQMYTRGGRWRALALQLIYPPRQGLPIAPIALPYAAAPANLLAAMYARGGPARALALRLIYPWKPSGSTTSAVSNALGFVYESLQGIARTALGPFSSLGNAAATAPDPYEATDGTPAQTTSLPFEALGGVASTDQLVYEALNGLAQTSVLPYESLQAIAQATLSMAYEALQGVASTDQIVLEALAGLAQTGVLPYESLQGVSSSVVDPYEAGGLTAVSNSGVFPYEALQAIAQTFQAVYEALGGVATTDAEVVESLGGIATTAQDPVESLGGVSTTAQDPIEATQGVQQTDAEVVEALSGITTSASDPIESAGAIQTTGVLPFEALSVASQTSVFPYESGGLTAVSQTAQLVFEALGAVASPVTLPYESQQAVAQLVVEVLESVKGGIVQTVSEPYEALQGIANLALEPLDARATVVGALVFPYEAAQPALLHIFGRVSSSVSVRITADTAGNVAVAPVTASARTARPDTAGSSGRPDTAGSRGPAPDSPTLDRG